jgi:hypothetical protein
MTEDIYSVFSFFIFLNCYCLSVYRGCYIFIEENLLDAFLLSTEFTYKMHDSEANASHISCPTLCILTDEHHCSYEKMKHQAPHFEIGKVVGSKCWATLEAPEQVNAMIQRFLHTKKYP